MIECTDKYIWYKKRRRFKFKRLFAFVLIITIVFGGFLYYKQVISRQIFKICADYAYTYSTEAVNQAVLYSLKDSVRYSDLVTVDKNNSGDIVLISTNSYKVNTINREVATKTKDLLRKKLADGIPIPILVFTGIEIISGYGSVMQMKTVAVANVICKFSSAFKSVGINQTLHSIYIDVESSVNIEVPFSSTETSCTTSVLISETVLVGKIPDVYLDGKLFC